MRRDFPQDERGVAVVIALLMALLIGAIAAALVVLTTTETLISASFRQSDEAAYGAEAALERGLHDLADDAGLVAGPGGAAGQRHLELRRWRIDAARHPTAARSTSRGSRPIASARAMRATAQPSSGPTVPSGACSRTPPCERCSTGPGLDLPLYLVVWVADDESDGDGNPEIDSNGRILVYAVAFGAGGARHSVEARVGRAEAGRLRLLAWRNAR